MRFVDKVKEIIKDDDYDFDLNEEYQEEIPLDELEKEIIRVCDKMLNSKKMPGLIIRNIYVNELNALIKEFNERCPVYDISYDELGILKDYSVKKYTGIYKDGEYLNGVKIHNIKDKNKTK